MGSLIEINDTLQLTNEQGFPASILNLERHQKDPITIDEVKDVVFEFKNKPKARIFQTDPVRVFLVHNIDGKWLFWGHALVQTQTIEKDPNMTSKDEEVSWVTNGTYVISKIYDPEYQKEVTINESIPGLSYF